MPVTKRSCSFRLCAATPATQTVSLQEKNKSKTTLNSKILKMKNLLITLFLIFGSILSIQAQMNISTNFRTDAIWDKINEEWKSIASDDEELTFFVFNKDFTMFKHTTAKVQSAYMIKSQKHDEEKNRYEFDVVSDVGNDYYMIFDIKNNNVRFIYERDDDMLMVQHDIKNVWFDED